MTEETTPRKRHQRRSAEQWRALIEAQARSGLSQAAFCEREGLCAGSFWNWRRRLQDSVAQVTRDSIAESSPPPFVEIGTTSRALDAGLRVRLDLGAGIVLELSRA